MAPFKQVKFGSQQTRLSDKNGCKYFALTEPLQPFPNKLTDKLVQYAQEKPDHIFIGKRNAVTHSWDQYTYAQTLGHVEAIAQFFIDQNLSTAHTIVILSENSIAHAFIALAAMHIGVTYAPISSAYSLVSKDFGKLKHCIELMNPKIIFAENSTYHEALIFAKTICPSAQIITADGSMGIHFDDLLQYTATNKVKQATAKVTPKHIAKVLFTSGSTGLPKGVMNHQDMICANLQQITQAFPFMANQPPLLLDWLPWNHTFGGNHNFGLTLYNGGTLLIDDGKPTAAGIQNTVFNLKEISPSVYFNVPKGFEMLVSYLEKDHELCQTFFKNLEIIFYAGASMAQPIWDKLYYLSEKTTGSRVPIITGLGCTESGPSAMFANWGGAFSGLLGVPIAGMEVKLVPDGDKIEARYKGPNITFGYYKNEAATVLAFDEEGYYKTGDAVKFIDENAPNKGLVFDGRIAEDFKLSTGTWVNVGVLRAKILATGSPIIQDAVITGLDKDFLGAILFLNAEACSHLIETTGFDINDEIYPHPIIDKYLKNWLIKLNNTSTGSSNFLKKYIIATQPPSIDLGEITDKGSLNQRAVLKHRQELVDKIYAD